MTRFRVALVVLIAAVITVPTGAQRRSDAAVLLEAARQKAAIDGDLRGAIDGYRQVIERYGADHTAVATAWLRMADLYETLGNTAETTKALERVLALGDQPEAVAVARERLGAGQPQADRPGRTVIVNSRTLNVEYPAVSADGRYLAFTDYVNANSNLMVRDLATGIDRQVTTDAEAPGKEVTEKAFSRDGRHVAYLFNYSELRLVDLAAGNRAEPRVLLKDEAIGYIRPYDWSADGKRIAVQASTRQNADAIGYVSVDDGQFHAVRTLDWRGSSRVSISPDGAYLAYDRRPDDNSEPDVYVVSSDGTAEVPVARTDGRDAVVGWSADGRSLVFTSDRDGNNSLFAQPMRAGRPNGRATLLRKDVALQPVGITTSGDVFFEVDPSTSGIYLAPADLTVGKLAGPLSKPINGERPAWSPDGTALAYANMGTTRRRNVIAIRTLRDGKTREFALKDLTYVQGFEWTADGRAIIAKGQDRQGRPGLFRIDARTGEVATIILQPGQPRAETFGQAMAWGGNSFAYLRIRTNQPGRAPGIREAGPDAPKLVERDLTSGEERRLFDFSNEPWATFGLSASPDRRFLAARSPGQGEFAPGLYRRDPTSFVVLHTLATGESRRIWTAPFGQAFSGSIEWLPDSSGFIVVKLLEQGAGRREAWVVPVDGSEPRKLDLGIQNLLSPGVRVSPDGRSLAILAGDPRDDEVQVYERLVPGSRR